MIWWNLHSQANRKQGIALQQDRLSLYQEIVQAHKDWIEAQERFNYVSGKDQVDYAIYAMQAAEKRYEMLIKQAKLLQVSREQLGAVMEG